jgi:hypothetical protein
VVQRAIGLPVVGSRVHVKEGVGRSRAVWRDFSSIVVRSVIPVLPFQDPA